MILHGRGFSAKVDPMAPGEAKRTRRATMLAPPLIGPSGLADWSVENALRRHVAAVLAYTEGSVVWAAAELGVSEVTVRRWLATWEGSSGGEVETAIRRGMGAGAEHDEQAVQSERPVLNLSASCL